ncbi:MAG: thiol peroxidase [Planctomycetaceae bacterium]|jgi:thioredoxin-dependent peroxiredoxin|nr:thiol peroxidase [Planctomycetaceae bacterium]
MAGFKLKGNDFNTNGDLPKVGSAAPAFALCGTDLGEISLASLKGKTVVLNIFPSIDTPTCALSVKRFNAEASSRPGVAVLCVSRDLPFAQKRFCGAEGLANVTSASDFRTGAFGRTYGVQIQDGPLAGLLARSVVVIGADGNVKYTELVPETVNEPNYDAALAAL